MFLIIRISTTQRLLLMIMWSLWFSVFFICAVYINMEGFLNKRDHTVFFHLTKHTSHVGRDRLCITAFSAPCASVLSFM